MSPAASSPSPSSDRSPRAPRSSGPHKPKVFALASTPALAATVKVGEREYPVPVPSVLVYSRVMRLWRGRGGANESEPESHADVDDGPLGLRVLLDCAAILVPGLERAVLEALPIDSLAHLVEFLLEEIAACMGSREEGLLRDPFSQSSSPSAGSSDSPSASSASSTPANSST